MIQSIIQIGDEIVINGKANDPSVTRHIPIRVTGLGPTLINNRLPTVAPSGHPIDIGSKTKPENVAPFRSTL